MTGLRDIDPSLPEIAERCCICGKPSTGLSTDLWVIRDCTTGEEHTVSKNYSAWCDEHYRSGSVEVTNWTPWL